MPGLVDANITAATLYQICSEVVRLYPVINPVFAVVGLLTLVELSYLDRVVRDIDVTVLVTVVDTTVATMYLRTFRHIDAKQWFPLNRDFIHRQIGGRGYFLWVVDGRDKVFADLRHSLRLKPLDLAGIKNAKKQGAAMPVQKGANRLVDIPVELVPADFELKIESFTLTDQVENLGFG
jgi:hypothetical protein